MSLEKKALASNISWNLGFQKRGQKKKQAVYYSHVYINLEELQGHDSNDFSIQDTVEWNNFGEDDVYELFHGIPEIIIFWKRLLDILNCSSCGCKEKLANESKVPDYDNTFIRSDIALAFFVDVWISSVSAILYQGLNV